jgi:hypothetical protein
MPGLLSKVKMLAVRPGKAPTKIKSGAFRGLRMELDLTYECQAWLGIAEREVQGWLGRLSSDIRTGMDIGAAAGEYAMYFLSKTSARRVLAFEPQPSVMEQLRFNLSLNGLADDPRVTLYRSYVGTKIADDHCTLDSLSGLIRQPCLVKIDVDGGESDVLAGAGELLRERDTRWLIETHSRELEEDCRRVLLRAGFTTVVVPNAWWRWFIPEQRPIPHNRWLVGFRSAEARKSRRWTALRPSCSAP